MLLTIIRNQGLGFMLEGIKYHCNAANFLFSFIGLLPPLSILYEKDYYSFLTGLGEKEENGFKRVSGLKGVDRERDLGERCCREIV